MVSVKGVVVELCKVLVVEFCKVLVEVCLEVLVEVLVVDHMQIEYPYACSSSP